MCRKDNPETFFVNIPFLQVMFQILIELRLEDTSYFLECLAWKEGYVWLCDLSEKVMVSVESLSQMRQDHSWKVYSDTKVIPLQT